MTGTSGVGIWSRAAGAFRTSAAASKSPDALRIPTAAMSPINVGRIPATVFIPSAAPFRKSSNTGLPDRSPNPTI